MMLTSLTDAEVIAASQLDPEKFSEIFERYFGPVHRFVRRRVGRELADDLAAETFVQAFGARQRYDLAVADARPWLFGIATNLVRHHARAERRRLLAFARAGVPWPVDAELEAVEARVDADAAARRLASALAALSKAERETLLLFVGAELSYGDIASALSVPLGTVRSRLNRARRKIRELMGITGQYGDEDNVVSRTEGGTENG